MSFFSMPYSAAVFSIFPAMATRPGQELLLVLLADPADNGAYGLVPELFGARAGYIHLPAGALEGDPLHPQGDAAVHEDIVSDPRPQRLGKMLLQEDPVFGQREGELVSVPVGHADELRVVVHGDDER